MYMPLTRRLTIVVFKARDLKAATEGYPGKEFTCAAAQVSFQMRPIKVCASIREN